MNEYIKTKTKSYVSSWLLVFFTLFLLALMAYSQFFRKSERQSGVNSQIEAPIKPDILANIKSIRIKNRLNSLTLTEENNQWMLTDPRYLVAKKERVLSILEALKNINVKNLHHFDPINLANFSLDRPLMSLRLFTKLDEEESLHFGLINPISNTTYLQVEGRKTIYQINILSDKIEALELSDLVDSKIFSLEANDIISLQIFKERSKYSLGEFKNEEGQWKFSRYQNNDQIKVKKILQSIIDMKAHLILDQVSESTQKAIDNYISNPAYTIIVKTADHEFTYYVSALIKELGDIKLEKRQNFLMTSNAQKYPYVFHKDNLDLFEIKQSELR